MYRQVLISIVIPMYNAEKYIGQMITSIIKQTYENWELIIIDDGSSDRSYEVCKLFDDQRIIIVSQENQGQMVARINGIAQAHGEYTLVVDADDYLETNCLEKIADVVNENRPDMVFFEYYSFLMERGTSKSVILVICQKYIVRIQSSIILLSIGIINYGIRL